MASLLTNSALRTDASHMQRKNDDNDQQAAGRARARRTALIVGAVALGIYVLAIVETALHK